MTAVLLYSRTLLFTEYYYDNQIKQDEMSVEYSNIAHMKRVKISHRILAAELEVFDELGIDYRKFLSF